MSDYLPPLIDIYPFTILLNRLTH